MIRSNLGLESPMGYLLAFVMGLCLLVCLQGCESTSQQDMVLAGELLLENALGQGRRETFRSNRDVPWTRVEVSSVPLDDDVVPPWGSDAYDVCVYMETDYYEEWEEPRRGDDLRVVRSGTCWGWILVNKKLAFHVLETGMRWSKTEDEVETESRTTTFVEAWERP